MRQKEEEYDVDDDDDDDEEHKKQNPLSDVYLFARDIITNARFT